MFPVRKTQRLVLRQLRQEDAADVYHYFSTDEVTAFYDLDRFTEVQQAEDLIQFWNDRFDTRDKMGNYA
ncbi:GNAT family N-acetyltransferase [Paenibacillus sp. EC2-1]|uniref:GNAT family N-acetyltransferase n=1 Tax=Paenibacillus sp. EC2-1 TaxID=3388665 RepID=UPI003BEF1C7B